MRHLIHGAIADGIDRRAASKGAALAFYTLFSMDPILVLLIASALLLFGATSVFAELKASLGRNMANAQRA